MQVRMNGGTNIALSIKQAGQLLKGEDPDAARIIVLLTDGRVDAFQGEHQWLPVHVANPGTLIMKNLSLSETQGRSCVATIGNPQNSLLLW